MRKLKLYKNEMQGSYAGGLLIVAANSVKEANEICMQSDSLENLYWVDCVDDSGNIIRVHKEGSFGHYSKDGFEEIVGACYNGNPCVVAEHSYYE